MGILPQTLRFSSARSGEVLIRNFFRMKLFFFFTGFFLIPLSVSAEEISVETKPGVISEEFSEQPLSVPFSSEPKSVSVPQTYTMAVWAFFIVVLVGVLSSARRRSPRSGVSPSRPVKNTSITKQYEGDVEN